MPDTSAMPTLRFGDSATAGRYPLPVEGAAAWRSAGRAWNLTLPLPELGTGTILVPSLTSNAGTEARHQWTLEAGDGTWPLQEVPGTKAPPPRPSDAGVSTHIDCYHLHRHLPSAELHLRLEAAQAPTRYLICVSARPVTMADPPLPPGRAALSRSPTPRSQMSAPEAIASRICSPTCVSMVLDLYHRHHDWLDLARECHDPVSDMYGVWPLATAAAARRGCLGAVEVFAGWDAPLAVLEQGVPLVASIRFSPGELPGSPLTDTGGHLVVVHAASPDSILVCDPAAVEGQVMRAYLADAFSRAWLRHRGAAYILPP